MFYTIFSPCVFPALQRKNICWTIKTDNCFFKLWCLCRCVGLHHKPSFVSCLLSRERSVGCTVGSLFSSVIIVFHQKKNCIWILFNVGYNNLRQCCCEGTELQPQRKANALCTGVFVSFSIYCHCFSLDLSCCSHTFWSFTFLLPIIKCSAMVGAPGGPQGSKEQGFHRPLNPPEINPFLLVRVAACRLIPRVRDKYEKLYARLSLRLFALLQRSGIRLNLASQKSPLVRKIHIGPQSLRHVIYRRSVGREFVL